MAYLLEREHFDGEFKKVDYEPGMDTILKDVIESQQGDFFKQQQEYFCETFNPDDFKKKFSSILDKAIEEDQKFDKQIQDNIKLLKNTLLGKAIDSVFTMREAASIAADKWCKMLFCFHIQDNGARECEFMCILASVVADRSKNEISEESKIKTRELLEQYYLHEIINDKTWLIKTLGTYTDRRGETREFDFFDHDLYCDYHPCMHLRRILSIAGIDDNVAESIAPFKTGIQILPDENEGYTVVLKTYGRRQTLTKESKL